MKGVSGPVGATPNTGEAVRQLRAARGISVRGLAARVGVSPATISAIEHGKPVYRQGIRTVCTAPSGRRRYAPACIPWSGTPRKRSGYYARWEREQAIAMSNLTTGVARKPTLRMRLLRN